MIKEIIKQQIINKNVKFLAKYLFNIDLTKGQEEIVRIIGYSEHKRIVISCTTRYGKSLSVSIGVLLYLLFNKNKKVIIIAPTHNQTGIVRNYIAEFLVKSEYFRDLLPFKVSMAERLKKEISKERITFLDGNEIRTLTAGASGEGLMGFGGDLIICDEDCLIDYEVFRSKISRMFGDNPNSIYVSIGNPWHRDNQMWENWTNPLFKKIHINYKQAIEEGRITKEFIEEQKRRLTDIEFKILYGAEFPETSNDALIDWKWIEKSKNDINLSGDIVMGIDVAEQGNDLTVVTIGIKNKENKIKILDIQSWGKTDLMPTVGKILSLIDKYNPIRISVDATGVGSGVYSRLDELRRENKIKAKIIAYKGGLAPKDTERFLNIKAESYWNLRNLFEEGKIYNINNINLINQLTKMKWELNSSGKIRILDPGEKQGDTSEKKSPDFSDSLNIMNFEGTNTSLIIGKLDLSLVKGGVKI